MQYAYLSWQRFIETLKWTSKEDKWKRDHAFYKHKPENHHEKYIYYFMFMIVWYENSEIQVMIKIRFISEGYRNHKKDTSFYDSAVHST